VNGGSDLAEYSSSSASMFSPQQLFGSVGPLALSGRGLG
jgi:hypothetical protein